MSARHAPVRRRAAAALCVLLGLVPACGGLSVQPIPVTVSRYDALAPLSLAEFELARESFVAGDVHAALPAFEHLFGRLSNNILVGIWLQESELAALLAASGADRADAAASLRDAFSARWAQIAAEKPTVANLVLAARVAPTPQESARLLAAAEALDPACAWIPYARAWMAAQASDWSAAREGIARAKAIDPGHVWTYWLEAWMTTRSGAVGDAASALLAFVERAGEDARVQPRLLAESQLDLAMVWTLLDEPDRAHELVLAVDPRWVDAARRLLALAAIEQALENLAPALAAAEAAEEVVPGDVLPVLQQALLYDEWLADPVRAEAAWRRVLEMARSSTELTAVLERTRAGVRIERFEAARARSAGDER